MSTVYSKLSRAATSAATSTATSTKSQPEVLPSSHQLKIDTLLNKKDTNIHVIKPHPTTATDNTKTDVLLLDAAGSPDASKNERPCHELSCHTTDINDDVLDCLFDDIDYHDLFDSEPLPMATNDRSDNVVTPQQQHEGSCDHNMLCDVTGSDDTLIEISGDNDDDVTDMSTVSCSKLYS